MGKLYIWHPHFNLLAVNYLFMTKYCISTLTPTLKKERKLSKKKRERKKKNQAIKDPGRFPVVSDIYLRESCTELLVSSIGAAVLPVR